MFPKMKYILLLSSLSVSVLSDKMPSRFKRCNYKDNRCLIDATQDALGQIANGVPEFNIGTIDPLVVPEFMIPPGKGMINVVQNYKNFTLIGVCSHKVTSLDFDLDKGRIDLEATFDSIGMGGMYIFDGQLLLLPIKGNGPFRIKGDKGTTTMHFEFDLVTKENQRYIKGKKMELSIRPSLLSFQFDNLFDGNKLLGDNINNVLNENWKDIISELGPSYFGAFSKMINERLKLFFDVVPVSEIFLDQN